MVRFIFIYILLVLLINVINSSQIKLVKRILVDLSLSRWTQQPKKHLPPTRYILVAIIYAQSMWFFWSSRDMNLLMMYSNFSSPQLLGHLANAFLYPIYIYIYITIDIRAVARCVCVFVQQSVGVWVCVSVCMSILLFFFPPPISAAVVCCCCF